MKTALIITLLLCSLPANTFTSRYLSFDEDRSIPIETEAEEHGGDGMTEYPMVSHYYVQQAYSAQRTFRTIYSRTDRKVHIYLMPQNGINAYRHTFGKLIEWRFRDGKPFAIIYRVKSLNERHKVIAEHLIVRSLDGKLSKDLNVRTIRGVNLVARKLADEYIKSK